MLRQADRAEPPRSWGMHTKRPSWPPATWRRFTDRPAGSARAKPCCAESLEEARRGGRGDCTEANHAMNDLADCSCCGDGRPAEAEGLFRACVKSQLESIGPRHPDTLTTQNNLASALGKMGRLEEAEALFRQTLETRRQVIGPEHPSTLANVRGLAEVVAARGRRDEAEALLRSCLEIQRRTLGPDHSDTRRTEKQLDDLRRPRARAEVIVDGRRARRRRSFAALGGEHRAATASARLVVNALV